MKFNKYESRYAEKAIQEINFILRQKPQIGVKLDKLTQQAILHSLLTIGTVLNNGDYRTVTEEVENSNPQIPWKRLRELRNNIEHHYYNMIDESIFDDDFFNDLTHLAQVLKALIPQQYRKNDNNYYQDADEFALLSQNNQVFVETLFKRVSVDRTTTLASQEYLKNCFSRLIDLEGHFDNEVKSLSDEQQLKIRHALEYNLIVIGQVFTDLRVLRKNVYDFLINKLNQYNEMKSFIIVIDINQKKVDIAHNLKELEFDLIITGARETLSLHIPVLIVMRAYGINTDAIVAVKMQKIIEQLTVLADHPASITSCNYLLKYIGLLLNFTVSAPEDQTGITASSITDPWPGLLAIEAMTGMGDIQSIYNEIVGKIKESSQSKNEYQVRFDQLSKIYYGDYDVPINDENFIGFKWISCLVISETVAKSALNHAQVALANNKLALESAKLAYQNSYMELANIIDQSWIQSTLPTFNLDVKNFLTYEYAYKMFNNRQSIPENWIGHQLAQSNESSVGFLNIKSNPMFLILNELYNKFNVKLKEITNNFEKNVSQLKNLWEKCNEAANTLIISENDLDVILNELAKIKEQIESLWKMIAVRKIIEELSNQDLKNKLIEINKQLEQLVSDVSSVCIEQLRIELKAKLAAQDTSLSGHIDNDQKDEKKIEQNPKTGVIIAAEQPHKEVTVEEITQKKQDESQTKVGKWANLMSSIEGDEVSSDKTEDIDKILDEDVTPASKKRKITSNDPADNTSPADYLSPTRKK